MRPGGRGAEEVKVLHEARSVELSSIFKWYASDFGPPDEVPPALACFSHRLSHPRLYTAPGWKGKQMSVPRMGVGLDYQTEMPCAHLPAAYLGMQAVLAESRHPACPVGFGGQRGGGEGEGGGGGGVVRF